jgi:hypothetical protein
MKKVLFCVMLFACKQPAPSAPDASVEVAPPPAVISPVPAPVAAPVVVEVLDASVPAVAPEAAVDAGH